MAHLPDLVVDYPNAKLYAYEIIGKAQEFNIFSKEDAEKYKSHIEKIDSWFIFN